MALSEFENHKIKRIMEAHLAAHRPPPQIRSKLDLGYRLSGQSVELFEIRPFWKDERKKIEQPVIKGTYIKSRGHWRVYWHRADLKWHRYEPEPTVSSLEELLALSERDEWGCFYG